MSSLATNEIQVSMTAIENERIDMQGDIGKQNARDIAIGRLSLLLNEQREALALRPYGFGHGWNVWALIVAIEHLRRAKRTLPDVNDSLATAKIEQEIGDARWASIFARHVCAG